MPDGKRLTIVPDASFSGRSGPVALAPAEGVDLLRFRIEAEASQLEALRHARRSMLREEWTLGRREDEPSLEDAIFSVDSIVWPASPEQRDRCLEKIAELEARVERLTAEIVKA